MRTRSRDNEQLFDSIAAALFEADPIHINFETNTDEYEPEAETILPRLHSATTVDDVERIVHEEFCRWFDAGLAGPRENYRPVAETIWNLWRAFKQGPH